MSCRGPVCVGLVVGGFAMLALLAAWGEATAADQPKAAAWSRWRSSCRGRCSRARPRTSSRRPTLEKYSEKPRPPFLAPEGVTNLAARRRSPPATSAPIIGELNMVTDGDKEGSDGSFVELGPGQAVGADRPGRDGRHLRRRRLALPRRRPRVSRRRRPGLRRPRLHQERQDGLQQRLRQLLGPGRSARTWSTSTTTAAS